MNPIERVRGMLERAEERLQRSRHKLHGSSLVERAEAEEDFRQATVEARVARALLESLLKDESRLRKR